MMPDKVYNLIILGVLVTVLYIVFGIFIPQPGNENFWSTFLVFLATFSVIVAVTALKEGV